MEMGEEYKEINIRGLTMPDHYPERGGKSFPILSSKEASVSRRQATLSSGITGPSELFIAVHVYVSDVRVYTSDVEL